MHKVKRPSPLVASAMHAIHRQGGNVTIGLHLEETSAPSCMQAGDTSFQMDQADKWK